MRSTAETWKDGPLAHYSSSGAGSGVVLRHLAAAAACACLTVDTAAAAALHAVGRSPDWASAIRCHNHCPNSRGFTNAFFLSWFLAKLDSRSRSLYPSVCLSVCLSVVCNVCAPYSGDWNFRQFLRHLTRWPSLDIQVKFYGDLPREQLRRGVKHKKGSRI